MARRWRGRGDEIGSRDARAAAFERSCNPGEARGIDALARVGFDSFEVVPATGGDYEVYKPVYWMAVKYATGTVGRVEFSTALAREVTKTAIVAVGGVILEEGVADGKA